MSGKRPGRRPQAAVPEATVHQGGTVSLFVSILVRYPEVASVTYRRETHSLKFTVLVHSRLAEERAAALRSLIDKSVRAYARLANHEVRRFDFNVRAWDKVSVVETWRDLDSLTRDELSMLLVTMRRFFGDELVIDQIPHVEGEDLAVQEELIEEMLDDLRDSRQEASLIAFRDEGRVLVYSQ